MLPTVYGHAGQLQQVVMNLCLNARDAIEAASVTEPRVEVFLDQLDVPSLPERLRQDSSTRHLRLRIRDNGIGMDEQTRTRIFDPFFTTKEIGQGTGLGLSTAYAIIDDHGGWIDVESQLGTGTQFSIYLPAGEETAPPSSGTDEVSGKFAAAGETILVVDDDPAVRRVLSISLNRAGYEVHECADGQSALDLVDRMSDRVSLVLLDISMPGMSGEQVLATLCARNPDLPIIILTGNNADSLHLDDAAAVVGKPISPENLLRVIGKTIAAKHMESQ
jgi:CheY-like chemotaxis protein